MTPRKINPKLKLGLELGPVIAFFVAYIWLRERVFTIGGTEYEGFIIVAAGFIPLLLASTAALWALTGKLSRMQIVTAVLVVVFGGMSVWFNDDRFFKMKPTIIYLIFAGILFVGLARGTSYLELVMEEMMPLHRDGWMILTRRFALFFLGLAAANEVIWRTMSTDAWVNFKTFGLTAAVFVFFLFQGKLLEKHAVKKPEGE